MKSAIGALAFTIATVEAQSYGYGGYGPAPKAAQSKSPYASYGQNSYAAAPYGQSQYAAAPYGQSQYAAAPYAAPQVAYSSSKGSGKKSVKGSPIKKQSYPVQTIYTPSKSVKKPTFAACELRDYGIVQMLQLPGGPIKVMAYLSGLDVDTNYMLTIHSYGNITNSCSKIGPEFNAIEAQTTAPYWNGKGYSTGTETQDNASQFKPFQSDVIGSATVFQDELQQNLAGAMSLLGLSLALTVQGNDEVVGCCIIGKDIARDKGQTSGSEIKY